VRILVTGATGFIGNHLIPALLEKNIEVIATYRNKTSAQTLPWANDVEWCHLDIFSPPENPFATLGMPDRMIHLAWHGLPNYKDSFHLNKNLPADTLLLQQMFEGGLSHMLVTGTCFEYGMQEGELSETMQPAPHTAYGQAKVQLQEQLQLLAEKHDAILQWARLFYTYGNGQNPNSLFAQLQAAIDNGNKTFDMSGGQQVRDYLPIDELVQTLISIVLQKETTGIINVCSGKNQTVQKLVEKYLENQDATIDLNLGHYAYEDYEPFRFWGSTAKLQQTRRQ